MPLFRPKIIVFLVFVQVFSLFGQEVGLFDISNGDPRRFLTVYEVPNEREDIPPTDTLWYWYSNSNDISLSTGIQLRNIVNIDNNIRIQFDLDEIGEDLFHRGSINITASVSRESGESPIEVLPYSRVGEEYLNVVGDRRSTFEMAKIFFNLVSESIAFKRFLTAVSSIENIDVIPREIDKYVDELDRILSSGLDSMSRDDFNNVLFDIRRIIFPIENVFGEYSADLGLFQGLEEGLPNLPRLFFLEENNLDNNAGEIIRDVRRYSEDYRQFTSSEEFSHIQNSIGVDARRIVLDKLMLLSDYLEYYSNGGERNSEIFLLFVGMDLYQIERLVSRIKNDLKLIRDKGSISINELIRFKDRFSGLDQASSDLRNALIESIPGSDTIHRYNLPSSTADFFNDIDFYSELNITESDILQVIANTAGKVLSRRLRYATIDLRKVGARDGDYIYINLKVERLFGSGASESDETNGSNRSIVGDNQYNRVTTEELRIARFLIKKTGWRLGVSESFTLVDRINPPDDTTGANVSPSNFKGSPGVALRYTWNNNGREGAGLMNFLQPSIGLDVAYVDFSTVEDLEVGVSTFLGLFDNRLFFNLGLNLNATRPRGGSPWYWGVGFGFVKLLGGGNDKPELVRP